MLCLLGGTLPLRYCSAKFASKTPFWALPVPGSVAGLLTDRVQAAHSGEAVVVGRGVGLCGISGSGRKRFRVNRKKPQHNSWDILCMLAHVFGRGCIFLGTLDCLVLIAEGGGAISLMVVTVLFLPVLVWVDFGVAQAHISRSAC